MLNVSNGKNHNKTIIFLCIICVAFSPWNGYNISKKTKVFLYTFHNVRQRNIVF
nr:MAG TPA: hypothetical protein [Caudoviricetes sp.]